jgi:hypothetical protein
MGCIARNSGSASTVREEEMEKLTNEVRQVTPSHITCLFFISISPLIALFDRMF